MAKGGKKDNKQSKPDKEKKDKRTKKEEAREHRLKEAEKRLSNSQKNTIAMAKAAGLFLAGWLVR